MQLRTSIIFLAITSLAGLTACTRQEQSSSTTQTGGLLSSLRPKADPVLLAKIKADEARMPSIQLTDNPSAQTRNLPLVSQTPFARIDSQAYGGQTSLAMSATTAVSKFPPTPAVAASNSTQRAPASYASYGTPTPGLVPPPPAVSLSTQAQPYNAIPAFYYSAPPSAQEQRPPGDFFGASNFAHSRDNTQAANTKESTFVPITPTGMDPRSPYKQRDDLRLLLKGALSTNIPDFQSSKDDKLTRELKQLDVGLPPDSTRGMFNVSTRQAGQLFKPVNLDKHLIQPVRKIEQDLVQDYYRYLYAYNRYVLCLQKVTAYQQVSNVVGSALEKQKVATDMSQAQSDADAAREDLHAAQYELSATVGPAAARTLIGRVSGVSPTMESLAQTSLEPEDQHRHGLLGAVEDILHPHHADEGKLSNKPKSNQLKSSKLKETTKTALKEKSKVKPDLAPAPSATPTLSLATTTAVKTPVDQNSQDNVCMQLRNVSIMPRKSVLKVAICNHSQNSFTFSPDKVSLVEGNQTLSEGSLRADFDSTVVPPHEEITGIITIFGRPWSDRLNIHLIEKGRCIQLRR